MSNPEQANLRVIGRRRLEAVPYSEIERGTVEWLYPGRVPLGGVTIVFGDPGLGKSQWTCLLAAMVTRGDLGQAAASVLMVTSEDDSSRTIRPRLEATAANLDLVHCVRADEIGLTLPDDVAELDRLVAETGARLVTIDPLTAHLASGLNSWRDSDVRAALRPLAEMAERRSCAVVPVMHMNKSQGGNANYRVGGSIAFIGAARSALFFARDPDDPEGERGRRRALCHTKSNLSEEAPTLLYDLEPILLPARNKTPEAKTSRLTYAGESARGSTELLAIVDEEPSALDEAVEFLESALSDGPALKLEIVKAARAESIAEKTLRRAREKLGVVFHRTGFPSRSYWSLPSRAQQAFPATQPAWMGTTAQPRMNPRIAWFLGASKRPVVPIYWIWARLGSARTNWSSSARPRPPSSTPTDGGSHEQSARALQPFRARAAPTRVEGRRSSRAFLLL